MGRTRTTVGVAVLALSLAACGSGYEPATGEQILADLDAAGLVDCQNRRSPFPDVITCVDPAGDVTVALSDDPSGQAPGLAGDGPFLIGDTWLVLTYDEDRERVESMQDALGGGVIWERDGDEMVPADS